MSYTIPSFRESMRQKHKLSYDTIYWDIFALGNLKENDQRRYVNFSLSPIFAICLTLNEDLYHSVYFSRSLTQQKLNSHKNYSTYGIFHRMKYVTYRSPFVRLKNLNHILYSSRLKSLTPLGALPLSDRYLWASCITSVSMMASINATFSFLSSFVSLSGRPHSSS